MEKIISEIKQNQPMWKKSLIVSVIIAAILFFQKDRFMAEFFIALLTAMNFLILLLVPRIQLFNDSTKKDAKIVIVIFLVFLFLLNYFALSTISTQF